MCLKASPTDCESCGVWTPHLVHVSDTVTSAEAVSRILWPLPAPAKQRVSCPGTHSLLLHLPSLLNVAAPPLNNRGKYVQDS